MCRASAGTWPWLCGPRMHSSWGKSTGRWVSLPSRGNCDGSTVQTGVPFHPPFSGTGREEASRDTWRRIRERGELTISMDPANLPYSSARNEQPGFDMELAKALAERLHVKLKVEWLDVQHETAVGKLLEHQCDLVFGEAIAANAVADDEESRGQAVVFADPIIGPDMCSLSARMGRIVRSLEELKGGEVTTTGY